MKSLKESIFKKVEDIVSNDSALVEQFLKDNYEINGSYTIKNGVVDVKGDVSLKNDNIKSLTNGAFRFRKVSGCFLCCKRFSSTSPRGAHNLASLKGAPEEVGDDFICWDCPNLRSLEYAPKKVSGDFDCQDCESLTSLEGASKEVGRDFKCNRCPELKTLKGAPQKIGNGF